MESKQRPGCGLGGRGSRRGWLVERGKNEAFGTLRAWSEVSSANSD